MHGFIVLKGSYGDLGCTTVDETKTAHLMESNYKSASVRDSKKEIVILYTNSAGPAFIYFLFFVLFYFLL